MNLLEITVLYFSYVILNIPPATAEEEEFPPETTVAWITVETTTEEEIILTDIPESDVFEALNLDVGVYTTQVYDYINHQFSQMKRYEKCYDDYIRCLITQAVPTPVCAVNDPFEIPEGYITYNSYCDVYFDNCRRNIQFWRILDNGECYHNSEIHFNLRPTKRDMTRPWSFIFRVLGSKGIDINSIVQKQITRM